MHNTLNLHRHLHPPTNRRVEAKELKELREQDGCLKRLLAEAELVKDALREVAKAKF